MKNPGMGCVCRLNFQKMVFIFFCGPQIEGVIRKRLKEGEEGNGEGSSR